MNPSRAVVVVLSLLVGLGASGCKRARENAQLPADSAGPAPGGETPEHATGETRASRDRVTLTPEAVAAARIESTPVVSEQGELAHAGLDVPGQVEFDPRRVALASPRAGGRLERLEVVEGDRVRVGQTVALVASSEFLTAQADFIQATRRAALLADSRDSAGAAAIAAAAASRLGRLGVAAHERERLAARGEPSELLAVVSPLDGQVMKAHVLAGGAVEAGTPLFEIADLSVVDVIAQVPERSLPLVRTGRRASVSIVAFPDMHFEGAVERLRGELNPETRTVQAVIHVPNPGGRLRPGMFATVRLDAPADLRPNTGRAEPVFLIPTDAVVNDGETRLVFVEVGERTYERREVRVEPHAAGALGAAPAPRVRVREGLRPGERVVVHGAFVLKSELGKAEFGEEE
jgi:RND family efflux transporter MFP subunit